MDAMLIVLVMAGPLLIAYTVLHHGRDQGWIIWLRYILLSILLVLAVLFYCLSVNASRLEQSVPEWNATKNAPVWRSVSIGMLSFSILLTLVLAYVPLGDVR